MKKIFILFPVLFLLINPVVKAQEAPDAAELTQMLHRFLKGASVSDKEIHDSFWGEDLIYTSSAGLRFGKEKIMSGLPEKASSNPVTVYTADEIVIQQYGEMAVVVFKMTATPTSPDASGISRFLNSGTFLKRNGQWKVINWQATKIPD